MTFHVFTRVPLKVGVGVGGRSEESSHGEGVSGEVVVAVGG